MTGHSKWANIQYRTKSRFARRGKIFTRMIREISIATHLDGSDVEQNSRLKLAIEKAKGVDMPVETINQTIAESEGHLYKDLTFEGFFMGDIAILIECVTDNVAKTDTAIANIFNKYAGSLATKGSVKYLFTKMGELCFAPGSYENTIENIAIETDAQDIIKQDDGTIEVLTTTLNFVKVLDAMKAADLIPGFAGITMHASLEVELNKGQGIKLLKFITALEDLEDTQSVYHNADIPPESYE